VNQQNFKKQLSIILGNDISKSSIFSEMKEYNNAMIRTPTLPYYAPYQIMVVSLTNIVSGANESNPKLYF
jgi:hypothetical protein